MINLSFISVSFVIVLSIAASGCGSTAKYPHKLVDKNQKLGVYAYLEDRSLEVNQLSTLMTLAGRNYMADIRQRLSLLPTHKTVVKYFLQSFPSRTSAKVTPILDSQAVFLNNSDKELDVLATGKGLSLDHVLLLKVKRNLKTTGYLNQEQWRPQLGLEIELVRVADGKVLLHDSASADGKAFDKYLDTRALDKTLESSFASSALTAVNELSERVGPPVRKISEKEKIIHQKIYDYNHIRSMASKNNCVISGDLKVAKTQSLVTYQVPCRDITLTYACDDESEASRCWLQ